MSALDPLGLPAGERLVLATPLVAEHGGLQNRTARMIAGTENAMLLDNRPANCELIGWLERIVERRDLTLDPPAGETRAAALQFLLATLAGEFRAYRDVVAGAREAARRNADELGAVVRATIEQGQLLRSTASAAMQAGQGAVLMATAAGALRGYAHGAAASATDADGGLAEIGGALGELECRLEEAKAPLAVMRESTDGVANFLTTLTRLSRHAQLLAVNASIEAAHLDEAGSRFAIVAREVRKLSTSTRDSKVDVGRIVTELRASTAQVASASDDSSQTTLAAATEIEGAGEALSETGRGIAHFEQMVVTVADVAAGQSTALESVKGAIDQIAFHSDEAAAASRNAAELNVETLLERAEAKAGRWTLATGSPSPAVDDDAFNHWIAAVVGGADASLSTGIDDAGELRPLITAVRFLLDRVHADQRDVLSDVVAVAVAVAHNGYAWRSIGQSLANVNAEIDGVRETIAQCSSGARTAADLSAEMQSVVVKIRARYDAALESLEGALTRISRITGSVREIDSFVESMNGAAGRADRIMALIDTLSSETDLLSLNAAIEAAHAGEQGHGFSIIAEEIRALARSTNDATVRVSQLVANISRISGSLQQSIGAAAGSTGDISLSAERVRAAITVLGATFAAAMTRAREVSATTSDQTHALDHVLESINRCGTALEANATSASDAARLELAMLGSRAHAIAAQRPLGTVIERVRAFGETLSERLEAAFESALAGGQLSLDGLFDLSYRPIAGEDIRSLARLFDVSRVPVSGFDPPKYATPWDGAVDQAMNDVLEDLYDAAADFAPVVIFVSDLNGFFYAYPRRKIAPWTNDPATDNSGNRIKRIFEDEYALSVGRWGLGPQAGALGQRCSYEAFERAGCELRRAAQRPWGGFVYARDTSMVCNEVVMALYARDRRHSTLRICYDPNLI